MAINRWQPKAPPVSQKTTLTPANVETGDLFQVFINSTLVCQFQATAGTVANVTLGLKNAWDASVNPYKTNITATDAGTHVELSGPVGMPFVVTTDTANGGATGDQALNKADIQVASGPNYWSVAANWSNGTVPANGDDVYIGDSAVSILWGLDQNGVTLTSLTVEQTYTGWIGLDYNRCATGADGTTSAAVAEYRDTALRIGVSGLASFGTKSGAGSPAGSGRAVVDFVNTAPTVLVENTATTAAETGRNALRLKTNNAAANLIVRYAPGGVGLATEKGGETSTIGKVHVKDPTAVTTVVTGPGCTISEYKQDGGTNYVSATGTMTTMQAGGGTLTTEGDFTVSDFYNEGAVVYGNHVKTGGDAVSMATLKAGETNLLRIGRAANWNNVTVEAEATFRYSPQFTTFTTFTPKAGSIVEAGPIING